MSNLKLNYPKFVAYLKEIKLDQTFIPDDSLFGCRFGQILKEASEEWERHFKEKGISYQNISLEDLSCVLKVCFATWQANLVNINPKQEYDDLIDMAIMLAERIRPDESRRAE